MKTYITLLRGINVGGKHILPMKELKALLEELDLYNVRTYIQSGNVVFESDDSDVAQLAGTIATTIAARYGFEPSILIMTREEMEEAISSNPFPDAQVDPKSLHFFFLTSTPAEPDLKSLKDVATVDERFALQGAVFYLHAPSGIGRSKLAARIEKSLGVPATGRNWRTVSKIIDLADA